MTRESPMGKGGRRSATQVLGKSILVGSVLVLFLVFMIFQIISMNESV